MIKSDKIAGGGGSVDLVDVADGPCTHPHFPDFFIIGAPKCGTTTLYTWLSAHPKVFMPGKELCFFSQDIYPTGHLPGHLPNLTAYLAKFAHAPSPEMVLGDATPKYLYSDVAIAEIARLSLKPRIIICLRDPVDLILSYHSQKVREGWEHEGDFAKAWARGINPSTGKPRSRRSQIAGETNYVFWARVGARLEKVFQHFAKEDVLVLLLDELRDRPRETYLQVLEFIGLADDGLNEFHALNERSRVLNVKVNRAALWLYRAADPLIRPFRQLRGGRGFGVLKAVNMLNTQNGAYTSELTNELREHIYLLLDSDIHLAERHLNGRCLIRSGSLP